MRRPELAAFALAAVVVICATVLLMAGKNVPDGLWILAASATTGGAGLAPGPRPHQLP